MTEHGHEGSTIAIDDLVAGEPSAVLLVDLQSQLVVHVNPVAQQLAPGVKLPARLDAWSDGAELRDPSGGLLSAGDHPLSRVARSEPVTGQAVSAARTSDMGERRQPLWVIAIPMQGAPGLTDHALVVMLPIALRRTVQAARSTAVADGPILTAGQDGPGSALADGEIHDDVVEALTFEALHSRAVLATGLSFTVADAGDPAMPLIWVNPAFTASTGYSLEDALGHNCRFLQGPGTDPAEPARIRRALEAGEAITTTLLNYTKDGRAYWNQVNISPIFDAHGEVTHFVGIQSDVSARVEADRARDAALSAEQRARAAAEAAEQRLQLMADASNRLSGTLEVHESHRRLIELLVPRIADYVVMVGTDAAGRIETIETSHADEERRDQLVRAAAQLPQALVELGEGSLADELLGPGRARLLRDLDLPGRGDRLGFADTSVVLRATRNIPTRSAVFVPLPGRQDSGGVLILGRSPAREQFAQPDLDVITDLGRRVGLILENTHLYQLQRRNSEVLQRSLLPALPRIDGIRSAARYHAGARGSEVGGDFYDLTSRGDGTIALAVGDVVGHDILAAAAMGHLKGLLRACVHDVDTSPARVLQRIDSLLDGLEMGTIASMVQAFLRPLPDGTWSVTWSSAGHPPLAVRRPDGTVSLLGRLDDTNDPLIGLEPRERREHTLVLPAGSTLLGYTDGLHERRGEVLDIGLERLTDAFATAPQAPVDLVGHLVETLTSGAVHDDDIALVAVTLGPLPD